MRRSGLAARNLGLPAGFAMARLKQVPHSKDPQRDRSEHGLPAGFAMARLKRLYFTHKPTRVQAGLAGRLRDGAIETVSRIRSFRFSISGLPAGFAMARLKLLVARSEERRVGK